MGTETYPSDQLWPLVPALKAAQVSKAQKLIQVEASTNTTGTNETPLELSARQTGLEHRRCQLSRQVPGG